MRHTLLIAAFAFVVQAAELKVGKPLALKTATPIEELKSSPKDFVGKTVQVKGKIAEVCQAMGCWMALTNGEGAMVRVQVDESKMSFPKDAAGRTAVAEGTFTKIELTKDQAIAAAKHEAEEQGRKFDPASVKGASVRYEIEGTGAVLL
jgi:hypothetical protein